MKHYYILYWETVTYKYIIFYKIDLYLFFGNFMGDNSVIIQNVSVNLKTYIGYQSKAVQLSIIPVFSYEGLRIFWCTCEYDAVDTAVLFSYLFHHINIDFYIFKFNIKIFLNS